MASGNHGTVKTRVKGMTIHEPYGKDTSDYKGSASEERGKNLAGGTDNLAHSLKGATAQQRGD